MAEPTQTPAPEAAPAAEGTTPAVATAGSDVNPESVRVVPETEKTGLILGKYKTQDEFINAHKELQREVAKMKGDAPANPGAPEYSLNEANAKLYSDTGSESVKKLQESLRNTGMSNEGYNAALSGVAETMTGLLKEQYEDVAGRVDDFEKRRDQMTGNLNMIIGSDATKALLESQLTSPEQFAALESLVGKALGRSPDEVATPASHVDMTPEEVRKFMEAKDPHTGRFLADQDPAYRDKAIALNKKMRAATMGNT